MISYQNKADFIQPNDYTIYNLPFLYFYENSAL